MMSEYKKLVPKRRFKEFKNYNSWEQSKLGELCDVYDGTHQTPNYQDSGIMFLSVENINTLKSEKYISEEDFIKDFNIFPVKGDVLMTRIGDIGTANVVETNEPIAYYVSLALLKKKTLDSYFLKESISSETVKNDLWKRTLHIAFPKKINKNEIAEVLVSYPEKREEQEQIGMFFKNIDNLITVHQRKLKKTKALKTAYLSELFPAEGERKPKRRFKGFTNAWEQHELKELSESFEYGLNAAAIKYDGKNKYIRITDIDDSSRLFLDADLTSPNIDLRNADNFKLKYGDILFARTGASVGKSYIYRDCDGLVYYAGFLIRVRIKKEFNPEFVFYYTLTNEYNQFIRITSQRSGQPGVNAQEYAKFKIKVPIYEEQVKIGRFFNQLDILITFHQRNLEKLQKIKEAYLNEMFVGGER
jgi:type I restriction enzyme S subunit